MALSSAVQIAKLIPGEDILGGLDTWDKVVSKTKLSDVVWKQVAGIMGDEDLDDLEVIAGTSSADYGRLIIEAKVNLVQQARLNLAVNMV